MIKLRNTEKGSAPPPIIAPMSINISAAISDERREREVFPLFTIRDTITPHTMAETIIVAIAKIGILAATSSNSIAIAPNATAKTSMPTIATPAPINNLPTTPISLFL